MRSRRQAVSPPLQQMIHVFNIQGTGGGAQTSTDGNANTFPRPEILWGGPPAAEREIKVGFMFLHDGKAVRSKHLHKYTAVKDVTEQVDTWLIDRMRRFYARHVATRRWIPLKKRLALAKFVKVSYSVGVQRSKSVWFTIDSLSLSD